MRPVSEPRSRAQSRGMSHLPSPGTRNWDFLAIKPKRIAEHHNWLPPSENVLAQATRCYQNRSRTFMTTCRGSKTLEAAAFTDCCGPLVCSPLFQGLSTLRSARSDLSSRLESATGRSGAYPDRTFTC